jgi:hypothetical protein
MLRKIILAAGATAVIAAAAMSPTTASAKGWKHHGWGHGWGPGFGISFVAPGYYGYGYRDCYIVRRVVWTKYGKRIRRIRVCD